jgi:adenosylhomocysteine nucleosidase
MSRKRIAIISAMEIELSFVKDFYEAREGWKKKSDSIYENEALDMEVHTKVLGIGKVNAAYQTADIITLYHPDLVINVGYAGGLVTNAKTGDVAIGTDYVQVDLIPYLDIVVPSKIQDSPKKLVELLEKTAEELSIHTVSGRIATGDFFLHDSEQKAQIIKEFHPVAFDMESAAIAQVCTQKETDFVSLRTFSDLGDEDAADSYDESQGKKKVATVPIERRPVTIALTALEQYQSFVKK